MQTTKMVRIGVVQWSVQTFENLETFLQQIKNYVEGVNNYNSDFVLFPELFNLSLLSWFKDESPQHSIIALAQLAGDIKDCFQDLAVANNINIISGSMPELIDGKLLNVGYVFRRDGTHERYEKLHITPDEADVWKIKGGQQLKTFETDCGKVGVLICYDVEFPELSRILVEDGMDILFVPFLTDTEYGYARVRHCAQARAIENECYVVIGGSVGFIAGIPNLDFHYAQSAVFTPCDFQFPVNGIKAEATPNTEMILIADVDIDLLRELHNFGSVKNLKDRRRDVIDVIRR